MLSASVYFVRPPIPSHAQRGEERIPFELFQEYIATLPDFSWKNILNASSSYVLLF